MNFRNAKYLSNGWIDCEIQHDKYGWIPFTCDPEDLGAEINTKELYRLMSISGTVEKYIPPTEEELFEIESKKVRKMRDSLLIAKVDPIASNPLRWASLTDQKRQEILIYRNELLNITSQKDFPFNIIWPLDFIL